MSAARPTDRFEVRLEVCPPARRWLGLARPARAWLEAYVSINGVPGTRDRVSIEALLQADADGTIFPFVCNCGDPVCAGYQRGVQLHHAGDETLWVDDDSGASYVFARAAFVAEIARLRAAVEAARARWPGVALGPLD